MTVSLEWDPNIESVGGYKMYWGSTTKNYQNSKDVGNVTTTDILVGPGIWYFAVTAYNDSAESDFSNEVHFP
jgi:hypothetical protein